MKFLIALSFFALLAVAMSQVVVNPYGYYGGYAAAPVAYTSAYGYAAPSVYRSAYASPYYGGLGYYGAYGYLKK